MLDINHISKTFHPGTIGAFVNVDPQVHPIWYSFLHSFNYTSAVYIVLYLLLIVAFNYFYVAIQYNPIEIANNLRKNNGTIPGIRPGKPTSDFITRVLNKVTILGAAFLAVVAALPIVLGNVTGVSIQLGGTSLLIVVGVALETGRRDGTQKWVDFTYAFWHVDCVRRHSLNAFSERYRKWCKRHGYIFKQSNAEEVYALAKSAVVLVSSSETTKLLVQEAANQLTSISRSVETYRAEMNRLASMLPEYPVVMELYGVGESLGPQLMAEIGDVRRFEQKKSLIAFAGVDPMPNQSGDKNVRSNRSSKRGSPYLRKTLFNIMGIYLRCSPAEEPVYQFLDRKRAEGKPFYVYMTAGANKFLRRYYAKVRDYLATLDDLPPVDMDSTGLNQTN